MPPPLTIPQHAAAAGNLRNLNQPPQDNSNVNRIRQLPQQPNTSHALPVMNDGPNPHLSSRFAGSGRQSSSSMASGGVTVSDGNILLYNLKYSYLIIIYVRLRHIIIHNYFSLFLS